MLLQFYNLKLCTWNCTTPVLKKWGSQEATPFLPRWNGKILSTDQNKMFFYSQSDLPWNKFISRSSHHLTLSAALDFGLLQVGEADEDGLANILLLLRRRVFHSAAAAPGLQQFLQHLNQRTQVGLKLIFSFWNVLSYSMSYILMALWSPCFPVHSTLPTNKDNFAFQGPKRTVFDQLRTPHHLWLIYC